MNQVQHLADKLDQQIYYVDQWELINLWNEYSAECMTEDYIFASVEEILELLRHNTIAEIYAIQYGEINISQPFFWLDAYGYIHGADEIESTPVYDNLEEMIAWYAESDRLEEVKALLN